MGLQPPPYPQWTGTEPCRSTDPEVFFPEGTPGTYLTGLLRRICSTCESRQPCAEYAIWFEHLGWWGGLSPSERRLIRRERGIRVDQSQRNAVA